MNRNNTGNQITNGMQILSVGGFTGAGYVNQRKQRKIADASSALNNMTEEEVKAVGQMRASKLNEEVRQHSNKVDGMTHLTDDEQQAFGDKKAEDLRSYINGENESVDELVSEIEAINSSQAKELSTAIKANSDYLKKRNVAKDSKTGRFVSTKKEKEGDK